MISATPTSGKPGDSISVTVTVKNNGPGNAAASTTRIRLASSTTITTSDPLLDTFTASALSPGQSQSYTRTVGIPSGQTAGSYYIGATANADGVLSEVNGSNNQYTTPFTVPVSSTPILSVTPLNPPTVSASGGTVPFNVSIVGGGGVTYSAAAVESWLHISSGASGGNNATIMASYDQNTGAQRSGSIQVTASGASGSPVTLRITQAAAGSVTFALPVSGKGDWIVDMRAAKANLGVSTVQEVIDYEKNAGMQWITVKYADGNNSAGWIAANGFNATLVSLCHSAGIKLVAWVFVYGGAEESYDGTPNVNASDVSTEIDVAKQALALGVDGLIIDAEHAYEQPGSQTPAQRAEQYLHGIRSAYPSAFLAYSTFWKPSAHRSLPFEVFGRYCDVAMPQVYASIHAAAGRDGFLIHDSQSAAIASMERDWATQQALWDSSAIKPIVPTAYGATPMTGDEITEFVTTLKNHVSPATGAGYQGVSFYDCDSHTPLIWNAIRQASIGSSATVIHTVTPGAGNGGIISPATPQPVSTLGGVRFAASPATQSAATRSPGTLVTTSAYVVDQWLVNGIPAQTGGGTFMLLNVTADTAVQVTFKPAPVVSYAVTPRAEPHGSITPSVEQTVAPGDSVTFTAFPDPGYVVDQWLTNTAVAQSGGSSFTLANVRAADVVQVSFRAVLDGTVTIAASPMPGYGGTVTGSGVFLAGGQQTVTTTANPGYRFVNWTENGLEVTSATNYTFTLTANRTFVANFTAEAIIGPDANAPALQITQPYSSDVFMTTTNRVTLAGTASDLGHGNNGISIVTVNGVEATGDTAANGGTANWSMPVSLAPGTNVLTVVAKDMLNNSNQQQVTIFFDRGIVTPVRLVVSSAYAGAVPPKGTNTYERNTSVSAAVTNSPIVLGTTQYVCRGWTGTGSVPASGATTNAGPLLLANDSVITWLWRTNFWLDVGYTGAGSLSTGDRWLACATNLQVVATPSNHWRFIQWTGQTNGCAVASNVISISMAVPRAITGVFDRIPVQPPTSIAASDGAYSNRIQISWPAGIEATGYEIWRSAVNSTQTASRIAQNLQGMTYGDVEPRVASTYYYWVRGTNDLGVSAFGPSDAGWRGWADTHEACWPFDEGSNTVVYEVSGNGRTGVLHGARWVRDTAPGTGGRYALSFDGTAGPADLGVDPGQMPATAVSVSVWFKMTASGDPWGGIASCFRDMGVTNGRGYGIYRWYTNDSISCAIALAGRTNGVIEGIPVRSGDWQHLVMTYDKATGYLNAFLNGQLCRQKAVGSAVINYESGRPLLVGEHMGCRMEGVVDEVRVYDRALPASEVTNLYQGLVAYYPFNGNGNDASENRRDAQVIGATLGWGAMGSGYSFDGVDDRAERQTDPGLMPLDELTVSAWFKMSPASESWAGIASCFRYVNSSNSTGIGIYRWDQNDRISCVIGLEGRQDGKIEGIPIRTNQWQQVVMTYDRCAGQLKAYLDGQLVGSRSVGSADVRYNPSDPLLIGEYAGRHFMGGIDEVRVYRRALDASTISSMYGSDVTNRFLMSSPPFFTLHPLSMTNNPGTLVTLAAGAQGSQPIRYQWVRNAAKMPGAVSPTNAFGPVSEAHQGYFWCLASNTLGVATSATAYLTVNDPPRLAITAPAAGSIWDANSSMAVLMLAPDVDGTVTQVMLYADTVLLGRATPTGPTVFSGAWSGIPAGTHTLTARAWDNMGLTADATPVLVTAAYTLAISPVGVPQVAVTLSSADLTGKGGAMAPLSRSYRTGVWVTLTAPPSVNGVALARWSGVDSQSGNTAQVFMNGHRWVTVRYGKGPVPTPWLVPLLLDNE